MTIEQLFKEHVKTVCKDCTIKDCDGIHITTDNKTKCERNYDMFKNK